MGMLNSWPMILACLETRRQRGTKRKAQFGNLSLALKLIALAVTVLIVVLAAASLSILFKNLPVCLLPSKGRGNCAGTASLASFYVAADIPSAGGRSGSAAFGRDGFQRWNYVHQRWGFLNLLGSSQVNKMKLRRARRMLTELTVTTWTCAEH